MAVSDLITSIRYQLHDTDANNWTGAEILDYINRGYNLIWRELSKNKSDLVKKLNAQTLTPGTYYYALPTDFWHVDYLQIVGEYEQMKAVDHEYIDTYDVNFGTDRQVPNVYSIYNGYFYIKPIPDLAYTLNEYYFYKPAAALGSADDTPFNGVSDEALIAFATGMCLNRDERSQGRQDKIISQLIGSAMTLFGRRDKTLNRINAYRWEYEGLV